jgi:hypothetical protein
MRQLRIKTRIYAGFGLLVACAAAIAGLGINRLLLVRDHVTSVKIMVGHVARLDTIGLTMEAVRRAALRVRTDGNETALATAKHGLRDIIAGLRLAEQEAVSDARRQLYRTLIDQTEA